MLGGKGPSWPIKLDVVPELFTKSQLHKTYMLGIQDRRTFVRPLNRRNRAVNYAVVGNEGETIAIENLDPDQTVNMFPDSRST